MWLGLPDGSGANEWSSTPPPWFAKNEDRLRVFFLPGYSPELNLDELLNQDVKTKSCLADAVRR